ncbi:T9SS type A sorting domain-containing protein [Flavobacterium buctense]|uniref:T9SS type A sorting domain-containing protein n=1 Tax=Flavobacterium buctense TaxID=1648146 RepID=A0ABU9DXH6_9FLAO|nr:T9SS type A sorting domain-containing protein [Flavobacterium buctense]
MKKLILFLFIVFGLSNSIAQNAADVETSFGPIPGFNGIIYATAQQPDGKILVGGSFTKYKGIDCKYFVRLLADGTVDPSFVTETTFYFKVTSIVLQPDGKILVSGGYTTPVNGIRDGVIRLNTDGSTDYTFSTITGFSGIVGIQDVVLQPDGKMVIVGGFSSYSNINRKYIVRINADGTLDTTFNPGSGFDNVANSIALQADGKIIAVGNFGNYNGYTRNKIIRLNTDGSIDLTFSIGVGFGSGTPSSVLVQPDGKIVTAGNFSTYKNVTQKGIIRLLDNGDKDTTLNSGEGFLTSGSGIMTLAMDHLGNFIVGGQFQKYNNTTKYNCVRLSPNGVLDNSFTVEKAFPVYSILVQNDQKIIVGGDNYISRVNNNSTVDYTFDYGTGFNNTYMYYSEGDSVIQPDGKIIVGGYYSLYGLRFENGLIRLNPDGTKDNTFNVSYLDRCYTRKMLLQPDGKIIAKGDYHYANAGSSGYFNFIRFNPDGSHDTSFNIDSFSNYDVDFTLQSDGKIIVCGGGFMVKRLNSNGTLDSTFNTGSGFNYNVNAVAVQNDGKIIVVGDFSLFNGEQHLRIVRLLPNGSLDTSFNAGEGFNSTPSTICLQPDGKILVGGYFGSYNVISAWGITRINTDGSHDATFNSGFNINNVKSIVVQPDGKIIAGGHISYFMGSPLKNLVRFNADGSVDETFDIGTGFDLADSNSFVTQLNLQLDGKILISGNFKNYKSISSSNIIRLYGGNSVLSDQNFTQEKLVLYPNPAHDFINIQLPSGNFNYDCEIFDLTGKLISQKTITNSKIDIQSLSKGIYILTVKSETENFTAKFIKE